MFPETPSLDCTCLRSTCSRHLHGDQIILRDSLHGSLFAHPVEGLFFLGNDSSLEVSGRQACVSRIGSSLLLLLGKILPTNYPD